MAEFSLPANSKIKDGKTHKAPEGATNIKKFKVYRYDPDSGENPRLGRISGSRCSAPCRPIAPCFVPRR